MASGEGVNDITSFFVEDYNKTGFPDKSFDVVWGLESICYAENKEVFLKEAWRQLKNGGRLIVADGFLNKQPSTEKERGYLKNWLEGWAVPNLALVTEFQKYLKDIGFQSIRFKDVTKNVAPSSKRMYLATIFAYPFAKIMQILGLRTEIQMKNMRSAFCQYYCLKRGLWGYGIFYATKPQNLIQ